MTWVVPESGARDGAAGGEGVRRPVRGATPPRRRRWLCMCEPQTKTVDFDEAPPPKAPLPAPREPGKADERDDHLEDAAMPAVTAATNQEGSPRGPAWSASRKVQRSNSVFRIVGTGAGKLNSQTDGCAIAMKNEKHANSPTGEVTRIHLVTFNKPGLLSTVVALFASFNLAIESAQIRSLKGHADMVDDIFLVFDYDTGEPLEDDLFESLAESIRASVSIRLRRHALPVDPSLNVKAPIGNVTLVFTDVESSTMLWDELPQYVMEDALEVHNNVVRKLLRTHGGYEVKTEGDGFMVAFGSARGALAFALGLQTDLLGAEWPVELQNHPATATVLDMNGAAMWRGFRVRAGMHTGTAIVRPDMRTMLCDYFGPVVNCAARISSLAKGGEVLLSNVTMASLSAPLPKRLSRGTFSAATVANDNVSTPLDKLETTCLGEKKIRGISEMVVVYRAWHRDDGALSYRAAQFGRSLESREEKTPLNIKRPNSAGEIHPVPSGVFDDANQLPNKASEPMDFLSIPSLSSLTQNDPDFASPDSSLHGGSEGYLSMVSADELLRKSNPPPDLQTVSFVRARNHHIGGGEVLL